MMHWNDFTGKEVVVHSQGTTYKGRMIEMTADSILLRADSGHREIPMANVTRIELAGGGSSGVISPSPLSGFTEGGSKK